MKFAVGDRVVRTKKGMWDIGTTATIVGTFPNGNDYEVIVDIDTSEEKVGWYEDYVELESIWNSPLYQALL